MNRNLVILLLTLSCVTLALPAGACDSGTVRDAAFHSKRDIHHLYLIANSSDASADETHNRLEAWIEGDAKSLNVELVRIDADDPGVRWADYGIPSAPPSIPVVALMGEFPSPPRAFVIDYWEPGPTDDDLAALLTSPARERLTSAILDYWVVVLHSPGTDGNAKQLDGVFDAVAKRWAEEQSPGVTVVEFDRTDPHERLLCSFAGIRPSGPDWAGVVFGRGRLLAPPLQGDEITEDNLNGLIQGLAIQCTCLQEAMTLGLDIPMQWDEELDAKVTSLAPPGGYVEISIGERVAKIEAQLEAEVPDEERNVIATAVIPLAGAACVAIAAIAVVLWRSRRKSSTPPEA